MDDHQATGDGGTTDLLCRIPAEIVEKYADWTELVAFRFVKVSDDEVSIEVTNDMELLTRPEVAS